MTDVMLERTWDTPLVEAELALMFESAEGCLGLHRVQWCGSLLSADGRVMLCHFRAPDAESVRLALRQGGGTPGDAWPCRVLDAPDATAQDLARVNVVTTHGGADAAALEALRAPGEASRRQVHGVRLVRTYASPHGRLVALYHAPQVEAVVRAQADGPLAAEAVWAVRRHAPAG